MAVIVQKFDFSSKILYNIYVRKGKKGKKYYDEAIPLYRISTRY